MKKHFAIKISGLVQGVFFRASTKAKADSLHLHGFVRNEPDGTVYAEAEGKEEDLKVFIRWCHRGPPPAKVEKCEVWESPVKNFSRFVIER
jgi:acylphosphatase